MQIYKLVKVVILFLVHVIWCVLIFVYQLFIIQTNSNISPGYKLNILFDNVQGIKKGTLVSYKGMDIGKVTSISLYTDYVIVSIYIQSPKILLPLNSYVKTYKTIFVADTILQIYNQNLRTFSSLTNIIRKESYNLYDIDEYCYNNDFIYGFQGASLDNLIDILIRMSIYLDNTDIIDFLYNLTCNCDYIITIIRQRLAKSY